MKECLSSNFHVSAFHRPQGGNQTYNRVLAVFFSSWFHFHWQYSFSLTFQAKQDLLTLPVKNMPHALAQSGRMATWPINSIPLITADMIDFGKTIGHGNWGSIRYGIVKVQGKKMEVAVKQPKSKWRVTKETMRWSQWAHSGCSYAMKKTDYRFEGVIQNIREWTRKKTTFSSQTDRRMICFLWSPEQTVCPFLRRKINKKKGNLPCQKARKQTRFSGKRCWKFSHSNGKGRNFVQTVKRYH